MQGSYNVTWPLSTGATFSNISILLDEHSYGFAYRKHPVAISKTGVFRQ